MRLLFILMLLLCASSPSQEILHVVDGASHSQGPLTSVALEGRIRAAADEYSSYAPIPRVAFFDVAYPADSSDVSNLTGHAVLLVTAIVQDSDEIPLTAVKITSEATVTVLTRVLMIRSIVPMEDDQIAVTFGRFREDSFYLLSLHSIRNGAELFADFAITRKDFKLGSFEGKFPLRLLEDTSLTPPSNDPERKMVLKFIAREYPGTASLLRD
jgi:hypothetical protein